MPGGARKRDIVPILHSFAAMNPPGIKVLRYAARNIVGNDFRSFIAAVRGRSLSLRSGGSGELSGPKQSLVFSQKPGGELFEPKMDMHVNFYVQIMY